MEQVKRKPGRPRLPEQSVTVSVRLTKAEREQLRKFGGSRYVKKFLTADIERLASIYADKSV
jgi:hypothetical protein